MDSPGKLSRQAGFQKAHTGSSGQEANGLSVQDQADMEAHRQRFGQDGSVVEHLVDININCKYVVFSVVLASCLQMGVCTNYAGRAELTCWMSDHGFVLLFAFEVLVRLMYLGRPYFGSGWNRFDTMVLTANVIESWVLSPLIFRGGWKMDDGTLITMKLLRMSRILRVVRLMRAKPQLLMVLEGLAGSLKEMIWVVATLGIFIYATAIFCVSVFNDIKTDCALNFSTLPDAFFTLFTLQIMGDWTDVVAPVWQHFWWASGFFIAFITLGSFGILNLIIGVIAQKTSAVQESWQTQDRWVRDCERMQAIHAIADIIFEMKDGANLSKDELKQVSTSEKSGPLINKLLADVSLPIGLGITDCHAMFDRDASGSITQNEFMQGMNRLIFNNDFQKNFMVQSSIADVLVEMKAVEGRLEQRIQKGFKRMECLIRDETPPADDEPDSGKPLLSPAGSTITKVSLAEDSGEAPRSPVSAVLYRNKSRSSELQSEGSAGHGVASGPFHRNKSRSSELQSEGSAGHGVAPGLFHRNKSRSSELQPDTSQGRGAALPGHEVGDLQGIPEQGPSPMPDLLTCRAIVQRLQEPLARLLAENMHAEANVRSPRSEAIENVGEDTASQPVVSTPPPRRCQNATSIDKCVNISQPEAYSNAIGAPLIANVAGALRTVAEPGAAPPRDTGGRLNSFAERESSSNESLSELMARVAEMMREPKSTAPPPATTR